MEVKDKCKRNETIALYMGYKIHDHSSYRTFEKDGKHLFESTIQYDSSWDWLMPVVEKIESEGCTIKIEYYYDLKINKVLIFRDATGNATIMTREKSKIKAVFLSVSDHCLSINNLM